MKVEKKSELIGRGGVYRRPVVLVRHRVSVGNILSLRLVS